MSGGGMAEGMESHACCGDTGARCGCAEGPLDARATHRGSRRGPLGVSAPGGRQEPGRVTVGLPGGAPPRAGLGGQGNVAVLGALATMAMDVEALTIKGRALEDEGC